MIGLLGGTFDPPHVAHVQLAEAALLELDLERLVVVPAGRPAHKTVETDAETRFRLAEAAFAEMPLVEVSRYELEREGPSYTVETARWAARELGEVVFVLGADEFADFPRWKEPGEILEHMHLAVAMRPGVPRETLETVRSGLRRPERVTFFPFPELDVASRDVRERIARGEPVDTLLPPAVERLVRELGLYGS